VTNLEAPWKTVCKGSSAVVPLATWPAAADGCRAPNYLSWVGSIIKRLALPSKKKRKKRRNEEEEKRKKVVHKSFHIS
jgi:hypothetical protein